MSQAVPSEDVPFVKAAENLQEEEAPYVKAVDDLQDDQVPYESLTWPQKIFVVLRPHWWRDTKQYFTVQECSGAFGDLGTLLPLVTALAVTKQITIGPTFFFAGLFSLAMSTYFGIPVPLQPMKGICAGALANKSTPAEIAAAGFLIGVIFTFLAASNLITVVAKLIPFSLVRGVQLSIGLSLLQNGVKQAYVHTATITVNNLTHTTIVKRSADQLVWWGTDSIFVSVLFICLCLGFMHNKRVPAALLIFIYGCIIAAINYHNEKGRLKLPDLEMGPDFASLPPRPTSADFKKGFVDMVLPQLPVSLLNGVLALERLASDYFPHKKSPATARRISASMAFDMVFPLLGMVPSGHGAGGLASQYAFGARSNLSLMFICSSKIVVSLLLGSTLLQLIQDGIFPSYALGVMVMFAGLYLSMVGLDLETQHHKGDVVVLLITAAASLVTDTGRGFLVGIVTYLVLRYVVNDPATYRMIAHDQVDRSSMH
ncbi:hypothetical protein LEN26_007423 [Aphanomyces euteiches]|nr:hypothetical protein LEN26_007423 [Aphanomyces euteiches]